jgi:hypothetical protein
MKEFEVNEDESRDVMTIMKKVDGVNIQTALQTLRKHGGNTAKACAELQPNCKDAVDVRVEEELSEDEPELESDQFTEEEEEGKESDDDYVPSGESSEEEQIYTQREEPESKKVKKK